MAVKVPRWIVPCTSIFENYHYINNANEKCTQFVCTLKHIVASWNKVSETMKYSTQKYTLYDNKSDGLLQEFF